MKKHQPQTADLRDMSYNSWPYHQQNKYQQSTCNMNLHSDNILHCMMMRYMKTNP